MPAIQFLKFSRQPKENALAQKHPHFSDRLEVLDLASVLSGNPGACSSEREDVGAPNSACGPDGDRGLSHRSELSTGLERGAGQESPLANSNSGDVLGNLEPGSITSGERAALTAGSGRAHNCATCPDVAGTPSPPVHLSAWPTAPATSGDAMSPLVSPHFSSLDPGIAGFNPDLDAEAAALEAEWLARGICMNAATFAVSVMSDSNSKSSITGA
jgi:hypothetical protein